MVKIVDIKDMPNHNLSTGNHGITSVSEGKVKWSEKNKAYCVKHGAINCVSQDRRIWRCIHAYTCREGCYVLSFD